MAFSSAVNIREDNESEPPQAREKVASTRSTSPFVQPQEAGVSHASNLNFNEGSVIAPGVITASFLSPRSLTPDDSSTCAIKSPPSSMDSPSSLRAVKSPSIDPGGIRTAHLGDSSVLISPSPSDSGLEGKQGNEDESDDGKDTSVESPVIIAAAQHARLNRPSLVYHSPPISRKNSAAVGNPRGKAERVLGVPIPAAAPPSSLQVQIPKRGGIPMSAAPPRQPPPTPQRSNPQAMASTRPPSTVAEDGLFSVRPLNADPVNRKSTIIDALRLHPPSPSQLFLRRVSSTPPDRPRPSFAPPPINTKTRGHAPIDNIIISTPYPSTSGGAFHFGPSRSRNRSRTASRSRNSRSHSRDIRTSRSDLVGNGGGSDRSATTASAAPHESFEPEPVRQSTVVPIVARSRNSCSTRTGAITIRSLVRGRGPGRTAPAVPVPEDWDDEGLANAIANEYKRLRGWTATTLGARGVAAVKLLRLKPLQTHSKIGETEASVRTSADGGETAFLVVPAGRGRSHSGAIAAYAPPPLPTTTDGAGGIWPATLQDAERALSDLIVSPRRGRDKTVCVAWLAQLPVSPNAPSDPTSITDGIALTAPPALPMPPLAIEILTGWRPGRVLAAWAVLLIAGAVALVLWVTIGVGGRGMVIGLRAVNHGDMGPIVAADVDLTSRIVTSNLLVAVDYSGWKGAGARVEAGSVLAGVILMFGALGIVGWGWVSWAVG